MRALVARRRARYSEDFKTVAAPVGVCRQSEGGGQDTEATKALGLTIPPFRPLLADEVIWQPAPRSRASVLRAAFTTVLAVVAAHVLFALAALGFIGYAFGWLYIQLAELPFPRPMGSPFVP